MVDRREFIVAAGTATTTVFAGCLGGGDDTDDSDTGDDTVSSDIPGTTVFEGDSGELLTVIHGATFEADGEFSEAMLVEGDVESTADQPLDVELRVELERYLDSAQTSITVDSGATAAFTIEFSGVDSDRIDEYELVVQTASSSE